MKTKFDVFKGQWLSIFTRTNVTKADDRGSITKPLVINAYLIDQNEEDYFFGDTPSEITLSISKGDISMMETLPIKSDEYDEKLDNFSVPRESKAIN